MTRTLVGACALLCVLAGCDKQVDGLTPVGGDEASPAEVERFVRRLHLDLTGEAANSVFVDDSRERILGANNSSTVRGELADELLADTRWSATFVDDVENRAFAGDGYEFVYGLLCNNLRLNDPLCSSCSAPPNGDVCGGCTCTSITDLFDERAGLESAASDLDAGTITTSEVERRFASAVAYRTLSGIELTATNLFEHWLGRPGEPDELQNTEAMIIGLVLTEDSASGLLFQRHGADFDDLVDIIFTSEVYREAASTRVFDRLLGRLASDEELTHFAGGLETAKPDVRPIIKAVVSSREYFEQ